MSNILQSKNLYIDSSFGVKGTGDDFEIYLPALPFTVGDRQYLRCTVQSMLGYKNFTDVNVHNGVFIYEIYDANGVNFFNQTSDSDTVHVGGSTLCELPFKNHSNIQTIVKDFGATIISNLTNLGFEVTNKTVVTQSENTSDANDKKCNLHFDVKPGTTNFEIAEMKVFFFRAPHDKTASDPNDALRDDDPLLETAGLTWHFNDVHLLMGGKVIQVSGYENFINCMDTKVDDITDAKRITIKSFYPMQRTTQTHVFLRSSLVNDSFQNHHFDSSHTRHENLITESTILCKAPIHDEFFSYDEYTGHASGYFVNCSSRSVTSIRFKLTDDKDRSIPCIDKHQKLNGNLSCQLVLRFDVIGT